MGGLAQDWQGLSGGFSLACHDGICILSVLNYRPVQHTSCTDSMSYPSCDMQVLISKK